MASKVVRGFIRAALDLLEEVERVGDVGYLGELRPERPDADSPLAALCRLRDWHRFELEKAAEEPSSGEDAPLRAAPCVQYVDVGDLSPQEAMELVQRTRERLQGEARAESGRLVNGAQLEELLSGELSQAVVVGHDGRRGVALMVGENLTKHFLSGDVIVFWDNGDHTAPPEKDIRLLSRGLLTRNIISGLGDREELGRLVRETWVAWAKEQPTPKSHWLVPWEELDEPLREVDRRIGEAVAARTLLGW